MSADVVLHSCRLGDNAHLGLPDLMSASSLLALASNSGTCQICRRAKVQPFEQQCTHGANY